MGKSYSTVLCVDIGSDTLKAAEFAYSHEGTMDLVNFDFVEFGYTDAAALESQETSVEMLIALKKLLAETKFTSKLVNVSLSAQSALIRFVKLPALTDDENKINQIIEFEAKQNSPFPMDKTVWDAQIVGVSEDSTEIDVMIIYVRSEEVESVVKLIRESGRKIGNIEVAPTAGYNACRANMVGENACEMILNIGGHCSTLSFVDNGKLFERTIPIAGNSITQQISKEFGISYKEAEEMKRKHGFVALGGAYEEPDSEVASIVSKIVRNVMTRLHGEISRSINIYRSQQKGRKPEKLYLAGGSSVMGYTPRFFADKLRISVEYLNPFKNIAIGAEVDKERLADIAHMFSEPIGLALRHGMNCPVEISLVPLSLQKYNEFKSKAPYFYASAASLLLCLLVTYAGFAKQEHIAVEKREVAVNLLDKTKRVVKNLKSAENEFNSVRSEYEDAAKLLDERVRWPELLNEVQAILPDNVWLTKFELSNTLPGQKNAQKKEESDGLFGGMVNMGGSQQQVSKDYVSVYLEGNGWVYDQQFAERFTPIPSTLSATVCFREANTILPLSS